MFNLPPPPRFTLPPPPIFPSDVFDLKILLPLTCSSIRQQQKQINLHLIVISCIIFFILAILLTLLFICIQSYHRHKSVRNNLVLKSILIVPKDISIDDNCSYATINSNIYLESINPSHIVCQRCHRISSSSLSCYDTIPY
ncbi:unnamed protein product [Rotaria sp. Silwood2]|nr:unnamed protein product [Rotaria sp. Silwood2]CAF4065778.1 unnamed protein product [Rotaria sp. Silwood2]